MYDKISILNYLRDYPTDIVSEISMEGILKNVKRDQQEICNLIEISDYINFYSTNGALDHTHIFHLKTVDPSIIKDIKFADKITIEYIPFINMSRINEPKLVIAFELIKLINLLVYTQNYSKIKSIDENRFSLIKK